MLVLQVVYSIDSKHSQWSVSAINITAAGRVVALRLLGRIPVVGVPTCQIERYSSGKPFVHQPIHHHAERQATSMTSRTARHPQFKAEQEKCILNSQIHQNLIAKGGLMRFVGCMPASMPSVNCLHLTILSSGYLGVICSMNVSVISAKAQT